jgi:hypothetical protein
MKNDTGRRLGDRTPKNMRADMIDAAGCITEVQILDISATGARIELAWGDAVPQRFGLRFGKDHQEHRAELIWRESRYAGVRFIPDDEAQAGQAAKPAAVNKPISLSELRRLGGKARR